MSTEESPTPETGEPDADHDLPPTHPDERTPAGDPRGDELVNELVDADEPDKWDGWVGEGEPPPMRHQD
ncbi:hypothetical protein NOCA2140003 [metagenome]|uniref:Uncharacterized protein n=1 Tax=metagenome TaxID=256318 RepID=A0A2P2BWS1_9ZZZZ